MPSRRILEKLLIEQAFVPINTTGAGQDGDWLSMVHGRRCAIVLQTGAWPGGTAAVTVEQATSNAGAGAKALPLTEYWGKTSMAGTTKFARTAIVANTFNLSAANQVVAIEVDGSELDVSNGFTHIRVRTATPGANADLVAALVIWGDVVYEGSPETLQDAKV